MHISGISINPSQLFYAIRVAVSILHYTLIFRFRCFVVIEHAKIQFLSVLHNIPFTNSATVSRCTPKIRAIADFWLLMYHRFLNNLDYLSIITEKHLNDLIREDERCLELAEEAAEASILEYLTENYEVEKALKGFV